MRRCLDATVSAIGLVLSAPLTVAIAAALRHVQGAPILFRQPRLGKNGRAFDLWKFRTMTDERGQDGTILCDAERMTPLGRWLRSTSLD